MTKYGGKPPYQFKVGDNMTGQCSYCGEVFYGEEAFDRHRQGEEPHRICVDPAEQPPSKAGRRYWRDNQDRWHFGRPIDPDEYDERRRASMERARSGQERPDTQDSEPVPEQLGTPGGSDSQSPEEPKPSGVPLED